MRRSGTVTRHSDSKRVAYPSALCLLHSALSIVHSGLWGASSTVSSDALKYCRQPLSDADAQRDQRIAAPTVVQLPDRRERQPRP